MQIILPTITFLVVSALGILSFFFYDAKRRRNWLLKRLQPSGAKAGKPGATNAFLRTILALGARTAPSNERLLSETGKDLLHAGYRHPSSLHLYFGLRTVLALGLTICSVALFAAFGSLCFRDFLLAVFPGAIGYYLPRIILRSRIKSRNKRIFRELPDVLDLLVICTEAGLGFDMALFRVSKELKEMAPVLSKEFAQYFFETRGGVARNTALANLVDRNDSAGLRSVVEVIIQSMKYGADIAAALRVHSDAMRIERRQIAEEKGAKIAVKLTLPLVLLILPALLIIILGPAVLKLMRHFSG